MLVVTGMLFMTGVAGVFLLFLVFSVLVVLVSQVVHFRALIETSSAEADDCSCDRYGRRWIPAVISVPIPASERAKVISVTSDPMA